MIHRYVLLLFQQSAAFNTQTEVNVTTSAENFNITQASHAGPEFQLKRLICSGEGGVPEIQSPCSEFQPEFKINFSWIQTVTEFS